MSAETLRRAATAIRDDWRASARNEFMFAVAEWLSNAAAVMEGDPPGLAEVRQSYALAVAKAYLQEDR